MSIDELIRQHGDRLRGLSLGAYAELARAACGDSPAVSALIRADVNHGDSGRASNRTHSLDAPLGTITAQNGKAICFPWMLGYYGNAIHSGVTSPVPTITTKDRHALCVALCRGPQDWPAAESDAMRTLQATMKRLGLCDVGFRMLSNPELARSQGFKREYLFHGNKSEITRQIGNSVSPNVAEAITKTIAAA